MKKAISLFLAVAVLCLATSALADPSAGTLSGARNGVTTLPTNTSGSVPCFAPGATLSFTLSGVTQDRELTVISYKQGSEGSLSDSNVQYINQYTLGSTSQAISYTIRDLDYGTYVLKFNDASSNTVATFYYRVGNATTVLIDDQGDSVVTGTYGTPYLTHQVDGGKYSIAFLGKVTIGKSGITLAELGAHPGFGIKKGDGTVHKYGFGFGDNSSKDIAGLVSAGEISGSLSFVYGLTIVNVPEGQQGNFTATSLLDANR